MANELKYTSLYLLYGLLAFGFMYVAVDFLVLIVFHFIDTLVLIVTYRDFFCYLVYRPQGCNKLELS